MSWIIRSSTTPMSVERQVNGPERDGIDVFRVGHVRRGRHEGRVESLDVADLQDQLPCGGLGDQIVGVADVQRHRLLDEHVNAVC